MSGPATPEGDVTVPDRYVDAIVVIKVGGHAMTNPTAAARFAEDVLTLRGHGVVPVVVHGGGPAITDRLSRLGITSEFAGGLRITDSATMTEVRAVLLGQTNPDLVGLVNRIEPVAVGLSGLDANLLSARQRTATVDGTAVDLGQVGDVATVNPEPVLVLLDNGYLPVVATVATGPGGLPYNVNADSAAAALAVALDAAGLLLLTDVDGLYPDWPATDPVLDRIGADDLAALLPTLDGGMAPKMEACLRAVRGGVPEARVTGGHRPGALLTGLAGRGGTVVLPGTVTR